MKQTLFLLTSVSLLSACATIPHEAYSNRGDPEGLLDVSSEIVNLDIRSQQSVAELASWIEKDQPSRAEVYCAEGQPTCEAALDVMELYGVTYELVPSGENMAALVYDRVLARDCENRFIDNTVNPYNLNHPTFGCSVAVNMVQHVSDKKQFVRPNLLGQMDAAKAVQSHQNYMIRTTPKVSEGVSDSLLSSAQSD